MKPTGLKLVMAAAVILILVAPDTEGAEKSVNCDTGQSIQKVIDNAPAPERLLVLNVSGTCYEDFRINSSRFQFVGDGDTTIHGQITVSGLQGSLSDFHLVGHIRIFGARVTIRNVDITGPGPGVTQSTGRTRLLNVQITGNEGPGIYVIDNGYLYFGGGRVAWNAEDGVRVENASVGLEDVDIHDNQNGINLLMSRAELAGVTDVHNNGNHGIDGNFQSSILMRGNTAVFGNSGSGVRLEDDSGLVALESVSMYANEGGNVYCADTESSVRFLADVPGEVFCTGFDQVAAQGVTPAVTFESGSGTYPAGTEIPGDDGIYISVSDDPLGPFSDQPVHFLGTESGGVPQIYRYRLDFERDVQLNSIVVSGAAWWGNPFGVIRVLAADESELVVFPVPIPPLGANAFQNVMIDVPSAVGSTFYLEEYSTATSWRYRSRILVNAY